MEVERPIKNPTKIIIENDFAPITKLAIILSGPALLVSFFVQLFLGEFNTSQISLDFVIVSAFIGSPFAFFIPYTLWKALGTKIILTDQKIIKKSPSGAELHLYWSEVKKIYITHNDQTKCIHLIFTRKKRAVPFDNANRICCPPGALVSTLFSKKNLPGEAAVLIRNKIHLYRIRVKGSRTHLDEIVRKSLQVLNRPAVPPPLKTGRKRVPGGSNR
jgi:hypothetical protein